jgi:hypothetical protein
VLSTGIMVRALIAGLCVAAAAAIAALLQGDFGDTHWRIVGTSLGFSFFTALGAAGDALRRHTRGWRMLVGAATTAVAAISFGLLLIGLWGDIDRDMYWQVWGACALVALCGSHASLVLRAQRPGDSPLIRFLVWTSIGTAAFDTLGGDLGLLEVVDDVSDGVIRLLGVVLVITVLSTALPPIMRRLDRGTAPADAFGHRLPTRELADEINAAATRIERVATPTDARREAAELRRLAERARG